MQQQPPKRSFNSFVTGANPSETLKQSAIRSSQEGEQRTSVERLLKRKLKDNPWANHLELEELCGIVNNYCYFRSSQLVLNHATSCKQFGSLRLGPGCIPPPDYLTGLTKNTSLNRVFGKMQS